MGRGKKPTERKMGRAIKITKTQNAFKTFI